LRQALTSAGTCSLTDRYGSVVAPDRGDPHQGTPLVEATARPLREVEGTYGIAVISSREPDTIVAARRGSPLLVAIATARTSSHRMPRRCWRIHAPSSYLDDGEISEVKPNDYRIMILRR